VMFLLTRGQRALLLTSTGRLPGAPACLYGSKTSKKSLKGAALAETNAKKVVKFAVAKDGGKNDAGVATIEPPSNYIRAAGKGTKSW